MILFIGIQIIAMSVCAYIGLMSGIWMPLVYFGLLFICIDMIAFSNDDGGHW